MARTIVGCGVVRRVEIQNFKVFARKMKRHKPLPRHKMTKFVLSGTYNLALKLNPSSILGGDHRITYLQTLIKH